MISHVKKSVVFKSSRTVYSDGSIETTAFTGKIDNPYLRKKRVCCRCGRNSHEESSCYAKTHVTGYNLVESVESDYASIFPGEGDCFLRSGVYVLSLSDGKYHVGQATDIDSTVDLYISGCGSEWSNHHGVVREVTPITGQVSDPEKWEKNETMELAMMYGVSNVRGHKWTDLYLDPREVEDFEISICESKKASSRSMWMKI